MIKNKNLIKVDQYINNESKSVNDIFRHRLHVMPPIGWLNDPNGFVLYKNKYHLFYQFYPYSSSWGPMFWGHVTSDDLLNWKIEPTALAPSEDYDKAGIFSGTALVKDEQLYLYYTGHTDKNLLANYDESYLKLNTPQTISENPEIRQVQCLATSDDGINFTKQGVVLGKSAIKHNGRKEDFRDPKVWIHNDKFYMVVGSKTEDYMGQILFYVSNDGLDWTYLNYFSLGKEYGTVWECPDIFELDNKYILIVSPQSKPNIEDKVINNEFETKKKLENVHSTFAFIGDFDYETGQFKLERVQDLDLGFDFYAPQTIVNKNNERTLIAWMNMWDREYVTQKLNHGWCGAMTIPRKLTIDNGRVYQNPISEITKYRVNQYQSDLQEISSRYNDPLLAGKCIDFEVDFEMVQSKKLVFEFFKTEDNSEFISLIFDKMASKIILDRSKSKLINESNNKEKDYLRIINCDLNQRIKLRVLLDVSSIEIFINDGQYALTTLFYTDTNSSNLEIVSEGTTKINYLYKWDLEKSLKYN